MPTTQQALVSFFEQAAQKNRTLLEKLKREQSFHVEQGRWCFTLPNLYSFLQRQDEAFSHVGYSQFRHLIFCSAINQTLKLYGAEITIYDNQSKVDKSGYALVWQAND